MKRFLSIISLPVVALLTAGNSDAHDRGWRPLFDGRDLRDWVAKINHHPLGENSHRTFVASDGILHVRYGGYRQFYDEFAHLFYREPLSDYRLRLDYRFVGDDMPDGLPWTKGNSAVMVLSQPPKTVGRDQPFPVAVQIELHRANGADQRPTGNICTPGTRVTIDGARPAAHCTVSSSGPVPGDTWVHLEIEVHAAGTSTVDVNGVTVGRFGKPELDPTDLRAMQIFLARGGKDVALQGGSIALQGEGHPIDFRNIFIREIDG